MSIRLWALVPLALSLAPSVHAQTISPAKADTKADESTAAMERAKRQAAGPMRIILEASKGKRAAVEPAAPPPVSESASVRTVSARNPAATDIATRSVPAPVPQPAAVEPTPTLVVPAPTASPVSTQVTLSSDSLQAPSMAAVPGLERATAASVPSLNLPAAQVTLPKLMDATAKPKLVNRVDPDLPQRLLDDLGRNAVVAVELNIRANGTVASVGMVTAVSPRLQRAVTTALEQWRFEPLASDRVHRIELVFNGE